MRGDIYFFHKSPQLAFLFPYLYNKYREESLVEVGGPLYAINREREGPRSPVRGG